MSLCKPLKIDQKAHYDSVALVYGMICPAMGLDEASVVFCFLPAYTTNEILASRLYVQFPSSPMPQL